MTATARPAKRLVAIRKPLGESSSLRLVHRMAKSRGTQRERAVRDKLREDGYVVYRPGASLGCADLVALKAGEPPKLVQVKTGTRNPYDHFRPDERAALVAEAEKAGAVALLAWWPLRGRLSYIDSSAWPSPRPLRAVA
jgi:Holliday junction resolvase